MGLKDTPQLPAVLSTQVVTKGDQGGTCVKHDEQAPRPCIPCNLNPDGQSLKRKYRGCGIPRAGGVLGQGGRCRWPGLMVSLSELGVVVSPARAGGVPVCPWPRVLVSPGLDG